MVNWPVAIDMSDVDFTKMAPTIETVVLEECSEYAGRPCVGQTRVREDLEWDQLDLFQVIDRIERRLEGRIPCLPIEPSDVETVSDFTLAAYESLDE